MAPSGIRIRLMCLAALFALCLPARVEKVVFDTDIGGDVDDALALAYLACEPNCRLLGVTIEAWGGNGPRQAEIASAVLRDLGVDAPIAIGPGAGNVSGQRAPAVPKMPPRYWCVVTNLNHEAFSPRNDAVDFLRRTIRANPGEVTIVATGHFTNLSALFAVDPELPGLLRRLVVMGGEMSGKGEWNAAYDPVATAVVFGNGNHARPRETVVLPADVTSPHHLAPAAARRGFFAGVPALELCAEAAECWYRTGNGLYFHDPMAAAALFHPDLCDYTNATVKVDLETGRTLFDTAPNAGRAMLRVATRIDAARFMSVFRETLRAPMTMTLTFDDAHEDHLTKVAPWLEARGWRGVFNVPTDWVGRPRKMTWNDLRNLVRRGHEVVPHGACHTNLVELLRSGNRAAVVADVARARDAFTRELGIAPRTFCLPFNACDAGVAEILRAAGMEPQTTLRVPLADFRSADRARRRGWRHVDFIAHNETTEAMLDALAARRRWLVPTSYAAAHPGVAGSNVPLRGCLCLTFDDGRFDDWRAAQPLFARYGAHATYYASGALGDRALDAMRSLSACGHTVGLHGVCHANAPTGMPRSAVNAWVEKEVRPQVEAVRRAKIPVFTFAYPNNRHSSEIDGILAAEFGFTHFRAGAQVKYAFKGDVTPETVQRFDTVDAAFLPVEWAFWKRSMNGIGIGSVYCYSRENVFRALRRAAERNEIVTFFSHTIKPGNTDWVGARTEWIAEMLAEADRLGMAVVGFDDLGRP